MKKFYYLIVIALLASCNTLKRAEKSLNTGDYNRAFDILIEKYQKGLSDKKYAQYLPALQQAYYKMVSTEEQKIENLRKTNNPAYFGEIYERLVNLDNRQSKLKPILPLYLNGRKLDFTTKNYWDAIENAKSEYANYLYDDGLSKMAGNDKNEFRKAYYNFKKVAELIPGYGDVQSLQNQAHYKGTEYILLKINNRSNQLIPKNLERDLTQINVQQLDDFWLAFHNQKQNNITYDYLVRMDIERIMVSPERVNTVLHRFDKDVVDGWEYLYQNGQQVLDSLGNPIKVDRHINVRAEVEETFQEKDALVEGRVNLIKLSNENILDYERLHSQFGFRNHFARVQGDSRAIDQEFMQLAQNRPLPFPSHEQMIYDCGEELKAQLKSLLKRKF